jgi:hypothetical protein
MIGVNVSALDEYDNRPPERSSMISVLMLIDCDNDRRAMCST